MAFVFSARSRVFSSPISSLGKSIDLVASLSVLALLLRHCHATTAPLLSLLRQLRPTGCSRKFITSQTFSSLIALLCRGFLSDRFSRFFLVAAGSVRNAFSPVLWASEPSAADSLVKDGCLRRPCAISTSFLRHFSLLLIYRMA